MNLSKPNRIASSLAVVLGVAGVVQGTQAQTAATYYQCPGNVFTNTIGAKEAEARHCVIKEAKEPTTIAGPTKPRTAPAGAAASATPTVRIDPSAQRARDGDARRILDNELKTEQDRLEAMQKDFNNGEPERQGNEKSFQKYLDRVAEMRAAIARKESDIAAIKRELSKLPQ